MTTAMRLEVRRGSVVLGSAVAALEVTALLIAAHLAAGGRLPGLPWIAVMAGATFVAGLPAVRGAVRGWVIAPALVAAQLGLHLWLDHLAPAGTETTVAPATSAHAHAGHAHLSLLMLAAHVAAALLGALLWELRRRAVEVLVHVHRVRTVALVSGSLLAAPRGGRPPALLRRLADAAPRRGPPVAVLAS